VDDRAGALRRAAEALWIGKVAFNLLGGPRDGAPVNQGADPPAATGEEADEP
jgi:hypothetical protein